MIRSYPCLAPIDQTEPLGALLLMWLLVCGPDGAVAAHAFRHWAGCNRGAHQTVVIAVRRGHEHSTHQRSRHLRVAFEEACFVVFLSSFLFCFKIDSKLETKEHQLTFCQCWTNFVWMLLSLQRGLSIRTLNINCSRKVMFLTTIKIFPFSSHSYLNFHHLLNINSNSQLLLVPSLYFYRELSSALWLKTRAW